MERKEFDSLETRRHSKTTKKKRKGFARAALIMVLCIISFLGGRASAAAAEAVYGGTTLSQTPSDSIRIKFTAENKEIMLENQKDEAENSATEAWNLMLINRNNPIPEGFTVKLTKLKNGQSVDERIYPDLQKMMDDARAAGLSPLICSSYRTMDKQNALYDKQVEKYIAQGYSEKDATTEAAKWVAVPGTSEHQTGLAVDIVSVNYQSLDKQQENTAEQQWLIKNCHRYGFILRYPEDKKDITGIGYEPWHYRYVGKESAAEIMEKGICLEEYLGRHLK